MNKRKQDNINLEELICKARESKSEEEILNEVLAVLNKSFKEYNKREEKKDYSLPIYKDSALMGRLANGNLEATDVVEITLYYFSKKYPKFELRYTRDEVEKITDAIFGDIDLMYEVFIDMILD